jgi:formamidopyrimidine-DNA glycosylase
MRVIRRHGRRKEFSDLLVGGKITKVDRRGKYILLYLDSGNVLVVHFGMTGQLLRSTKRQAAPPHTHVDIELAQAGNLRYVDARTFGEMFVTTAGRARQRPRARPHRHRPARGHLHLAAVQLRAHPARGQAEGAPDGPVVHLRLGNIYSDEVLFAAGLRYDRTSDTLSSQEVRRLYRAMREIVQDAIRYRGTTLEDEAYVDLFGRPGEFQNELKVYGRKGLACRRCRTPIDTVKISGRNSYYCPQCQS